MRVPSPALASLLVLWVAASPARATVRAWLDSTQVAPGDSVELTLEYDGQANGQPDLTPLQKDFEILDSSTSTRIEIVNGRASARTQLTLSLSPRHAGRLTVPPIRWSGEQTPSLALNVTPTGHGAGAQARNAFFEVEVDPKQPYVQAAVRLTVRLYTRESLYRPSLTFESSPAAVIRQIGSDDEGSLERGGEPYEVLTRHYLLFPQRSGALSIPGPVLQAQVAARGRANVWGGDPFSGGLAVNPLIGSYLAPMKSIRVQGDAIALNVRPRPAAAASSYWLPARAVTLQSTWNPPALQAHVGDPLTVDLSLEAEGLTGAQLPDLTQLLDLPPGVRAYPDAPKLTDAARGGHIVGIRTQSLALIADEPGRFVVPALHVRWWDTESNAARDAVLPERVLDIVPAAAVAGTAAAPSPSALAPGAAVASGSSGTSAPRAAGNLPGGPPAGASAPPGLQARQGLGLSAGLHRSPWLWVSVALALAWVATLLAWLRLRRRIAPRRAAQIRPRAEGEPSLARARTAFRSACRGNDAAGARRQLLAWIRASWPRPTPAGLNAFARQIGDLHLARLVRELDRACYTGDAWRGAALAEALTELPLPQAGAPDSRGDAALAPLYGQIDAAEERYV